MNENINLDPLPDLPPDLAELDRELAGIRVEERPSFGPELETELGREWVRRPRWVGGTVARRAVAASVAALVFTGLAVPPARASLVTRLQQLIDVFQEEEVVADAGTAQGGQGVMGLEPAEAEAPPPSRDDQPVASAVTRSDGEPLTDFPPFDEVESTYPTLADRESDETLIRRYYPPDLQRRGIGGTVGLRLWVEADGTVDNIQVSEGTDVQALNTAALQAARSLRFDPATRNGTPVATWVEFDLVFEPQRVEEPLPEVLPLDDPAPPEGLDWEFPADWEGASLVPAPIRLEAQQLLRAALGDSEEALEARFGSLEGLLAGDPPAGVSPLRWRSDVARELERAMARDPDNPAPYLALARIRRKQGLREDARLLFEKGIERAERGVRPVSPRLVAELAYEHGRVVKEAWMGWRDLGALPVEALEGRSCPRRPGPSGDVDAEILIAWNYLCSGALNEALTASFAPISGGEGERRAMLGSFEDAVEAYPGHVGANVEILLDRADQELWMDVLNGARRFAWATQGHPYALMLSGLALQRMGRAEEARDDLERAIEALSPEDARGFLDPTVLAGAGEVADGVDFWAPLDPVLGTEVNERRVEHLARAAYAHLRFGGLDNDAARLWLRYGTPQRIRAFGGASGLRTELWDYGDGPDVTFTRPSGSEERTFTPEAQAYLDDLREVFPHWYGSRARAVYTLPAQVARFRGESEGTVDLVARLQVPEELRPDTDAADSLVLGMYLLGPSGEKLSEHRERIPARASDLKLIDDAGPAVSRVVVELYSPSTHRAAALRLPARRGDEGGDRRISDLLLVEPAAPMERDIGRSDSWVSPLDRRDLLDGDQVGVLFELYDLPDAPDPYRVSVDLVSEATGQVIPVDFRPSGQQLFGAEWARRPAGRDGRTVEYLTLDLTAVGPGSYTLRTRVALPDGGEVVEVVEGLRRRLPAESAVTSGLERSQFD